MKNTIYVERQYYVTAMEHSLKFVDVVKKTEKFIPFDEIEFLVFDDTKSYFSNKLVSACIKNSIGVLFCDDKHMPISMISSDFGCSQRLKRIRQQLDLNQKTKNRLWRKIVVSKINNQSACLKFVAEKVEEADFLTLISKQVDEGDRKNREAYAANRYFYGLFGKNFKRGRYDDAVNAGLNYGYAILRGLIRKELAVHGFEMSFGIHHQSTENPFNLSDDIIEPYRPFADAHVYEFIYQKDVHALELEDKKLLIRLLMEKCVIDGKVCAISDAIKVTATSLIACFENNSASHLKLPSFVEVGK